MASKTEAQWQAESDASTLARANEIMSDSKRYKAATKAALSLAKELNARANAMNKVASSKRK